MAPEQVTVPTVSSIVDNQEGNTLDVAIKKITRGSKELCVATAFFSLDALALVAENLHDCDRVRILFGDEADRTQRRILLTRMRDASDRDLGEQRLIDPNLDNLKKIDALFKQGKIEARCYTTKKFHAKAYLALQTDHEDRKGILGSGNFTRPGLTRNIELNVRLSEEQTSALHQWFEDRWAEAINDVVTDDVEDEIKRQLDLYDPYAIYQRALLAWGNYHQGGIEADRRLSIKDDLDPHQALGYSRALEILDREHGVMICDGVGLGKSYIALALMEHYCREKRNVLLIAPKSIMESSWNQYLEDYLEDFRRPFGTIDERFMTDFGFDLEDEPDSEKLQKKQKELLKLIERADVIVIDESHNFRKTNSLRYSNIYRLVESVSAKPEKRKKVVMLTATPVNTEFADLSAQLALITHETGTLAGYAIAQIRAAAKDKDNEARDLRRQGQGVLDFDSVFLDRSHVLTQALEAVVIQRKRSTCIDLAQKVGKELVFPHREKPTVVDYALSPSYLEVVETAHKRFAPTAAFLKRIRDEYRVAEEKGVDIQIPKMPTKFDGIKFAGFLPEQYRTTGTVTKRSYQVETFLAGLVFVNTLKQLESSPAAFQGILQSLGTSLIARLQYVFNEDARDDIAPHLDWVRTPINQIDVTDADMFDRDSDALDEGENSDVNGDELDEWLEQAVSSRKLHHKLADFTEDEFDIKKWRRDIVKDLAFLKEIHEETMQARMLPDYKLETLKKTLRDRLEKNQRVVIFTQSQRTAFYLEKQLQDTFGHKQVARIDSNVEQQTRAAILYAFCPKYNPKPKGTERAPLSILICTDVLSEGVNMQEAECIVNYDIHWNPVRLIQRIGRVDRRLNPALHDTIHSISILNVFPPKEINDIINLVGTVEGRTLMIDHTMGIDKAFFKSTDPEGTLKEFNAHVDGEKTDRDKVVESFIEALAKPDKDIMAAVQQMPPGAFGVWDKAPHDGVFALFEMEAKKEATEADLDRFKAIIGKPMIGVDTQSTLSTDGIDALVMLSKTVKGEKSAAPGDPAETSAALKRIKNAINQSFRDINLPATIQPKLVCWLEMRAP